MEPKRHTVTFTDLTPTALKRLERALFFETTRNLTALRQRLASDQANLSAAAIVRREAQILQAETELRDLFVQLQRQFPALHTVIAP